MDWATNLQVFTPLSIGLLITYLVLLAIVLTLLWRNQSAIGAWFVRRLVEGNSQHAINTALTSTSIWLTGGVALSSVVPLWTACLGIFLKPETSPANPPSGSPGA